MPDGLGDAMVFALGFFLTITIVGLVLIVVWELMTKHRRLRLLVFFLLSIPISAIAGGLASSVAVFFVCLATLNTMILSCDLRGASKGALSPLVSASSVCRRIGWVPPGAASVSLESPMRSTRSRSRSRSRSRERSSTTARSSTSHGCGCQPADDGVLAHPIRRH